VLHQPVKETGAGAWEVGEVHDSQRHSRTEERVDDEQADCPDATDHIEQAVTALDMRAALAQLSPEHRQVVGELYYQDRSVAETARRLGIPAGTVKSRAYYALRRCHIHQEEWRGNCISYRSDRGCA
jgi:RNA polymerase sigma factor (sigma-70 family)